MEQVLDFCRAREVLQRVNRGTQEERKESTEAARALMGMLKDSMIRHNVECIEIPGKHSYVKMTNPPPKRKPLRTEEDVADLIRGVGDVVEAATDAEIPTRVTDFVVAQLRQRTDGTPPEPKISIVSRPVRLNTVDLTSTHPEVRNLTEQFVQTCETKRRMSQQLKPLKNAQKQSEKTALETFTDPVCVRMRKNGKDVDLRVVKCRRKQGGASRALGIRLVLTMCRDAAEQVCSPATRGDRDFETAFRDEVLARVRTHLQTGSTKTPEYYLKVYKLQTN